LRDRKNGNRREHKWRELGINEHKTLAKIHLRPEDQHLHAHFCTLQLESRNDT